MRAPRGLILETRRIGAIAIPPSTVNAELELRDRLSSLQGLLVLSMLMTESDDEERIVELAANSVGALGPYRLHGVHLIEGGWRWAQGSLANPDARAGVDAQFAVIGAAGGAIAVPGDDWCWAFPLRSLDRVYGYLLVGAKVEPDSAGLFLLRVLAQQAGIALANTRAHLGQRRAAEELRGANHALAETIAVLEHRTAVHDRLTRASAEGEGEQGIAQAVHELTGLPAAIEDRHGNLRAWAGPGRPEPYPKESPAQRDAMIRRAVRQGRPIHEGGRLIALAGPHDDALGVLALIDPGEDAGEHQQLALEHGATVLALELLRLRGVAEVELRIGRDLVDELLAGTDAEDARRRARAMGYDLERPHRVVVIENHRSPDDSLVHSVRRAARAMDAGSLLRARGDEVVLLADADVAWEDMHTAVLAERRERRCRLGVGGVCTGVEDFPRSYREARLALRVQDATMPGDHALVFDDLGVYRLLADVRDPTDLELFAREWLGALIEYDGRRGSELVMTLSRYLEGGRSYEAAIAALSVHRSTLRYRLGRIAEISGHNLGDPGVCFNLQLATRAWHTLLAVRGAAGAGASSGP